MTSSKTLSLFRTDSLISCTFPLLAHSLYPSSDLTFLLKMLHILGWHFSLCLALLSLLPPIVSTLFPSCLHLHSTWWDECGWGRVHTGSSLETDWFIISLWLRAVSMVTTDSSTNLTHTKDTPFFKKKQEVVHKTCM